MRSKLVLGVALGLVSGLASAQSESQAFLMCGTTACAPDNNAVYMVGEVTGINDLNVDGDLFDVTFTSTASATSPFVLSNTTAAAGKPLTGIDAALAIANVYNTLPPPYGDGYSDVGDFGPAFITALGPAGSLSSQYFGSSELFDVVQTNVGGGFVNVGEVGAAGYTSSGVPIANPTEAYYTTWTLIAAPEIDASAAISGIALLLGGIAVAGGRKQRNPVR